MIKSTVLLFAVALLAACTERTYSGEHINVHRLSPNDSFLLAKHSPPEFASLQHHPSSFPDRVSLSWEGDVYSSLSITWRTDTTLDRMELQYAKETPGSGFQEEKSKLKSTFTDVQGISYTSRYHKVHLTNLAVGTHYTYRIGNDQQWSEWANFETPALSTEQFKFIYMGDAQNRLFDTWARVMRRAYAKCPEAAFVLHAGDLINHADNDYEWAEFFAATEPFNKSIPIIATPGNHEYVKNLDGEKISFSKYWNPQFHFPVNGPESFNDQTYYIDYGNARIISLNSNRDIEQQAEWLDEVLSDNPLTWTVVTFHHPVYSGSKGRYNNGINQFWKPILDKHHVDLVLQGHDHTYARGTNYSASRKPGEPMQGSLYVVSVSGDKQYTLEVQPWMDRQGKDLQLYQVIEVDKETIHYQAYTADDVLYDDVRIEKVKDEPNRIFSDF